MAASGTHKGVHRMAKGMLVLLAVIIAALLLAGCETAKGLRGDLQFIGDKTYEIVDK